MIKELVQQGLGSSVLPAWMIQDELETGSLVALELGRRRLVQTWGLWHWRGRPLNRLESTFVHLCKAEAASFSRETAASPRHRSTPQQMATLPG